MKTLATKILENANKSKQLLTSFSERVATATLVSDIPAAQSISNVNLVLDHLIAFYEDTNNAEYFPHHADAIISNLLDGLLTALAKYDQSATQEHAVTVIAYADQLYMHALQLGLISFGLDSNSIKQLVHEINAKKKYVQKATSTVEQYLSLATEKKEEITSALNTIQAAIGSAEKLGSTIASLSQDAQSTFAIIKSTATQIGESAKAGQAALDSIQQSKANTKEELDEINRFYGEIEQHKKAMIEIKKEADAKFNQLSEQFDEKARQYSSETEKIVQENVNLQKTIKENLQKAVGISLFHAFDTRRRDLGLGKWVWAAVLVLSVFAGCFLSWWLANSLHTGGNGNSIEPAFFIKLSAIIPVTFAIAFAARQYGSERRVEEEYAFKSAISVSLEPYKDLLQRMKDEGQEDQAKFVERLLIEIFDNPVLRVYSNTEEKKDRLEKAMTLKEIRSIVAVSKDLDIEKVKQVVEILSGSISSNR
ncbi:MAG: hypothetical protein ABUS47_07575 [Steroidobacter sp.]